MEVSLQWMSFQKAQWYVTHKIQYKGGIKPCNESLYVIDSLCNCGKTVNQLLLEDISAEENNELFEQ